MKSIDPAGLAIRADKASWQIDKNVITLEGGVQFSRTPPAASKPDIWGGPFPHITINTELERLHIP